MSDSGAVIVGALIGAGAALLGSIVTAWLVSTSAGRERRSRAYVEFIATSGLIGFTAQGARTLLETTTGLNLRAPDPMAVVEVFRRDLAAIYRARSEVSVVGSEAALTLASKIVDQAGKVIGTGSEAGRARGQLGSLIAGQKFTPEQQQALEADLRRLGELRDNFADLARTEGTAPWWRRLRRRLPRRVDSEAPT